MKLNRCVACGESALFRFDKPHPWKGTRKRRCNVGCSDDLCPNETGVKMGRATMVELWNYLNPWRPMVGDEVWALAYNDKGMYMKQATIERIKVEFPYIAMENIDLRNVFETEEEGQAEIKAILETLRRGRR